MGHHTPPSLHRSGQPRMPLNTLAIGFGAAGLASLWTTVTSALRMSPIPSELLWICASIVWAWLIFAHLYRGRHSDETLRSQLRHPAQGPIAAIVPVIGMLIGAHLHQSWPVGGTILVLASIVTAALFAGWILAYWHTGRLTPEAIHGGYFLPTVAAALVGATTSYRVGFPMIALGALAVGIMSCYPHGTAGAACLLPAATGAVDPNAGDHPRPAGSRGHGLVRSSWGEGRWSIARLARGHGPDAAASTVLGARLSQSPVQSGVLVVHIPCRGRRDVPDSMALRGIIRGMADRRVDCGRGSFRVDSGHCDPLAGACVRGGPQRAFRRKHVASSG